MLGHQRQKALCFDYYDQEVSNLVPSNQRLGAALPRSTRQIGAWVEKEFGLVYESRSGLIALLHRLGLEYHKPSVIPRKLDEEKQRAFIESYDNLLNSFAIEQTSGRQRINIHGAINPERLS